MSAHAEDLLQSNLGVNYILRCAIERIRHAGRLQLGFSIPICQNVPRQDYWNENTNESKLDNEFESILGRMGDD